MNLRPQNRQVWGFSPLCIFRCLYKDDGSARHLPQISHFTNGRPFSPINWCTFRPLEPLPLPLPILIGGLSYIFPMLPFWGLSDPRIWGIFEAPRGTMEGDDLIAFCAWYARDDAADKEGGEEACCGEDGVFDFGMEKEGEDPCIPAFAVDREAWLPVILSIAAQCWELYPPAAVSWAAVL